MGRVTMLAVGVLAGVATCLVHTSPSTLVARGHRRVNLAAKRPEYIPGRIDDPNYVRIFDTTLRDGEQSPGATLTSSEKLEIAKQLALVGVDIIEAGFPIASPDDFEAVRQIARIVGNEVAEDGYVPVICGLSRANKKDILRAWEAVSPARRPRVHTFIATSKIHMEDKLKKTPEEVIAIATEAVLYAKSLGCEDIEFSPEDAGRSDPKFLYKVLAAVIEAGATTLNIPDTTGWNMPWEFGGLIADLRANVPNATNVVFSTHCQNDLGLATANSLAGALNGARQIECTINGIGERAGNAALEEVVMALALKGSTHFDGAFGGETSELYTGVDATYITPTSKMVEKYTGMQVQPHKAIVGANAFQHESGIHQDGMIKNKKTYEIMTPESVGLMRGSTNSGAGIVLGKHSGRNAFVTRLKELGYGDLSPERLEAVFARFKHYAERKKGGIQDDELEAIVGDEVYSVSNSLWALDSVQVTTGSSATPTATVVMSGPDGVQRTAAKTGSGPVDACYKAIDELMGVHVELETFGMESVNAGIHALATTRVVVRPLQGTQLESSSLNANSETKASRRFHGSASDNDIIVSSARAYLAALNKLLSYNLRTTKDSKDAAADAQPEAKAPAANDKQQPANA